MAHFYPWPDGDGQLVYLFRVVFRSTMAVSIVLAEWIIRKGRARPSTVLATVG